MDESHGMEIQARQIIQLDLIKDISEPRVSSDSSESRKLVIGEDIGG